MAFAETSNLLTVQVPAEQPVAYLLWAFDRVLVTDPLPGAVVVHEEGGTVGAVDKPVTEAPDREPVGHEGDSWDRSDVLPVQAPVENRMPHDWICSKVQPSGIRAGFTFPSTKGAAALSNDRVASLPAGNVAHTPDLGNAVGLFARESVLDRGKPRSL